FARAVSSDTDLLAIRNLDGTDWLGLDVTIRGFVTTGGSNRQPTGPYRSQKGARSERDGLLVFDLKDFQKPSGERWAPLTMSVADIELKASLRGEACSVEVSPGGSDAIGR